MSGDAIFVVENPVMIAPEDLLDRIVDGLIDIGGAAGFSGKLTLSLHVPIANAEQVEEAARRGGVTLRRV